jgi:hypothetical protein
VVTVRRPGDAVQTVRMAVAHAQTARMVGDPCDAAQSAMMYGDALRPSELEGALAWSICTEIAAAASLLRVG